MTLSSRVLAVALMTAFTTLSAQAQIASDEIVGWMKLTCLGSSDTIVSPPLARPAVYAGTGTGSTVSAGVTGKITFTGTPFTASQYKYVAGTQPNTYYAFIASGSREGAYFPISDNDGSSVTIALNGDSVAAVTAGTSVRIVPFWTLGTFFPSGAGVTASTSSVTNTQVILPNLTGDGINLAPRGVYVYSSSSGYWTLTGVGGSQNDVILYPDSYLTVRNNGSATTTIVAGGAATVTKIVTALSTNTLGKQDNYVALPAPLPLTLNNSGLISSGAFSASTGFASTDQLMVFDNTVAQLNKAAKYIYTYANGAWRRAGVRGDVGGETVFTPGTGVIIRKAKNAGAATSLWTAPATP